MDWPGRGRSPSGGPQSDTAITRVSLATGADTATQALSLRASSSASPPAALRTGLACRAASPSAMQKPPSP
jgi:hypothetical protein